MTIFRESVKRATAAVALIAFGATNGLAEANEDRIATLQEKFRCPIFDYLEAIHKYPTPQRLDNRFLIITIAHRGDERYYAQCAFDSMDTRMLCELDSPANNPVMKKYFRGNKLELVKALGYRLHPRITIFSFVTHARRKRSTTSQSSSWIRLDAFSTCGSTKL